MSKKEYLPSEEELQIMLDCGSVLVIYPDGARWCVGKKRAYIGSHWDSDYWDETVEIVEMSEDRKTVWVEDKF